MRLKGKSNETIIIQNTICIVIKFLLNHTWTSHQQSNIMHVFYCVIKSHTRVAICSSKPMLDRYLGECMVSKNPCDWYQNVDTNQMLIFGEKNFVYPSYYLGEYHSRSY